MIHHVQYIYTVRSNQIPSGADVTSILPPSSSAVEPHREQTLRSFVANNLFITHAFYTHPKILITALNGPAIGLSAALIAHSDFIYAAPHAFILTPFTSLGLVAEGGASRAFVKRLGIAKANEALIMSKRIGVEELVGCGFVNGIIESTDTETEETKSSSRGSKSKSKSKSSLPSSSPPSSPSSPPSSSPDSNSDRASQSQSQSQSTKFLDLVLKEIEKKLLGGHLNSTSLLEMKALIRKPDEAVMGSQTVAEVLSGLKRFETRVPYEEFGKVRGGSKRHKL